MWHHSLSDERPWYSDGRRRHRHAHALAALTRIARRGLRKRVKRKRSPRGRRARAVVVGAVHGARALPQGRASCGGAPARGVRLACGPGLGGPVYGGELRQRVSLGMATGVVAGWVRALVRALRPAGRASLSLRDVLEALDAVGAALVVAASAVRTVSELLAEGTRYRSLRAPPTSWWTWRPRSPRVRSFRVLRARPGARSRVARLVRPLPLAFAGRARGAAPSPFCAVRASVVAPSRGPRRASCRACRSLAGRCLLGRGRCRRPSRGSAFMARFVFRKGMQSSTLEAVVDNVVSEANEVLSSAAPRRPYRPR